VYELLGHDNLERPGLRQVDARKVDQNEMMVRLRKVCIRAANRRAYTPTEPAFKNTPLRGDPKTIHRQAQERDIPFEKLVSFHVIDVPTHEGDLPGR
jgi:hypothetical protein